MTAHRGCPRRLRQQPLGRRLAAAVRASTSRPSRSTTSTGAPPPPSSPATHHDAFAAWTRAYQRCLEEGSVHRAAHFGARIGEALGFMGDLARCRGWVDRGADLLDAGRHRLRGAGLPRARARASCGCSRPVTSPAPTPTSCRPARSPPGTPTASWPRSPHIAEGRMLIYLGDLAEGMALLDGAHGVDRGRRPLTAGHRRRLLHGDRRLLRALRPRALPQPGPTRSRGGAPSQQELVLYRGHCFMHRAEVTRLPRALARGARRGTPRL